MAGGMKIFVSMATDEAKENDKIKDAKKVTTVKQRKTGKRKITRKIKNVTKWQQSRTDPRYVAIIQPEVPS